jgi:hypothetical protein
MAEGCGHEVGMGEGEESSKEVRTCLRPHAFALLVMPGALALGCEILRYYYLRLTDRSERSKNSSCYEAERETTTYLECYFSPRKFEAVQKA